MLQCASYCDVGKLGYMTVCTNEALQPELNLFINTSFINSLKGHGQDFGQIFIFFVYNALVMHFQ